MRRMLIVDDERDICACLEEFFKAHDFSIVSAFSGEEAMACLEHEDVDVILLDILLPGLSGLEILKRAKAKNPRTRVIIVTALDEVRLRREAWQYGAMAYVTKPFDFSETTWAAALQA